jgi:2-keto-3-deoxy-L-rhamnonate aldolase RhmA
MAAEEVHLHATNGKIYIGGADVTTANGYEIDAGDQVVIQNHTNAIYAIAAAGTHTISVLVIQK